MGYCADGYGTIRFRTSPSKEVLERIESEFEYQASRDEDRCVSVWAYDKYHEDCVLDVLHEITPFVESGVIEYRGDDDCFWRFRFDGERFIEENGHVVYEGDESCPVRLENSEKLELLCGIIETFENFLDDRGIVIENDEKEEDPESASNIYGTDYGDLESEIESVLQKYGLLPV